MTTAGQIQMHKYHKNILPSDEIAVAMSTGEFYVLNGFMGTLFRSMTQVDERDFDEIIEEHYGPEVQDGDLIQIVPELQKKYKFFEYVSNLEPDYVKRWAKFIQWKNKTGKKIFHGNLESLPRYVLDVFLEGSRS